MSEGDSGAKPEHALPHRRTRRFGTDPELRSRSPEQLGHACRLGRGQEEQLLRGQGQLLHPALEAFLDPALHCLAWRGEAVSNGWGRQVARQLQQRKRITACLCKDPLSHALIARGGDDRPQQLASVRVR